MDFRHHFPYVSHYIGIGAKECGSWNAECGNYKNQTFSHFLFHIPHSEFPIRLYLKPEAWHQIAL
jgi:hypothetical protein